MITKKLLLVLFISSAFAACTGKKTETISTYDSLAVDSALHADTPAPSSLAVSEMTGYAAKNTVNVQDSINFILLTGQEELDKNFVAEKNSGGEVAKPDFIINYIIGVTGLASQSATTISVVKAEILDSEISVYLDVTRGEKLAVATKPARVFALERRDGISTIQFYVNGKKDKSFFMTGL